MRPAVKTTGAATDRGNQTAAVIASALRSVRNWIGGGDEGGGDGGDETSGGSSEPKLARISLALVRTLDLAALVHGVRRR